MVLAGYTGGDLGGPNAGETDLVAVKLSSDGVVVWRWQVSRVFRSAFDVWSSSQMFSLWHSLYSDNINSRSRSRSSSSSSSRSSSGSNMFLTERASDATHVCLRSCVHLRAVAQGGTAMADVLSTVLVTEDGSTVLAGYTSGDWSGNNAGEEDYLVVKVSTERSPKKCCKEQECSTALIAVQIPGPASAVD